MARTSDDKSKFLQILAENPAINYACKKVGIGRTTIYRWMKDNPSFRGEVERALASGRAQWNEIAEAALFKKVREGHFSSIKFYLTHNDAKYIPKRSIFVEPLNESERRQFEKLLRESRPPLPRETVDKIIKAFQNYGIVKSDESNEDAPNGQS